MPPPAIAPLDQWLTAAEKTQRRAKPIPGLGFSVESGLVVVAAAPTMGTTSLALKIAVEHVSDSSAFEALVLSPANGPTETARRLKGYSAVLARAVGAIDRIWIDDGAAVTADEIVARVRNWVDRREPKGKLVVVDDLQHLAAVEKKAVAGAGVAATLRALASELDARIILCARLPVRRHGSSWLPKRSELLAYGPMLQHCDGTILIYRDAYYGKVTDTPWEAELSLWPPQSGRSSARLSWDTPRGVFGTPI